MKKSDEKPRNKTAYRALTTMNNLHDIFPQYILDAAPVPDHANSMADYLNHLADQRPDLHGAALPWATHHDLVELILMRHWSRIRKSDLQALVDIAEHDECDFWVSLAILLRLFPDADAPEAVTALAQRIINRMNADALPLRFSETPIISNRSLELYERVVENIPALQISAFMSDKARAHADWVKRGRASRPQYAMFGGMPIWAANHGDTD